MDKRFIKIQMKVEICFGIIMRTKNNEATNYSIVVVVVIIVVIVVLILHLPYYYFFLHFHVQKIGKILAQL